MRTLGIDYGEKRIGLAISDRLGIIAQGLKVVSTENFFKEIEEIKTIIKKFQIGKVVIGIPKNIDGSIGKKAREVLKFIEQLRKYISLPLIVWDERFTTKIAKNILINANMSRKKRKNVIDKMSAVIILQEYLDRQKR